MAKAKNKAKKKTTRKKTDEEIAKSQGMGREIIAIILIGLAILLLLASFNIGGSLPTALIVNLRLVMGYAAYMLPALFGVLAFMLFMDDRYEMTGWTYTGFVGIILSLTGLLHVGVTAETAQQVASNGQGGGYLGYALTTAMFTVLNQPASVVVLLVILAISLILASSMRLRDIWQFIRGLFERGEDDEVVINEPITVNAPGPKINSLPIKGTIGGDPKPEKEPETALVSAADPEWVPPSIELVQPTTSNPDPGNINENLSTIKNTLESFGIEVAMGEVNVGPTVTQYTMKPSSGVKLNKITGLDHNLALSLAAKAIRIEAPIPGKSAVGIEIPNKKGMVVRMRDLLTDEVVAKQKAPLTFLLGRDVSGTAGFADLAKMPHMLIAGQTGSGKSVMINSFLTSLLYRNAPSNLKLILVDPKRVELTPYNNIPHLLTPVIVEPEKCISALKWAVAEMERRYKLFAEVGKRNIIEYNSSKPEETMPYIVIVIDELADLMVLAAKDVETLIVRLAQMARATGIHLVLATQRPSVNVITGLIKANIPARIAFSVTSQIDSRTILDSAGAEKLVGRGDMLFVSPDHSKPQRIQGVYMDEKEIHAVTKYLREAREPQYNDEVLTQPVKLGGGAMGGGGGGDFGGGGDDDLFNDAADTVIRSGKASASLLQRRLRVGYARAARLLDLLEERGVVGPADGARPRDVLVSSVDELGGSDTYGQQE
jgi:S-DNA-T family DNA segregation ATPase FtsK/SpoIIIE